MVSKIEQDRYDKNAPSVHKVCEELGFKLNSGCPDWIIYIDNTRQGTVTVPDDFMAHLALMFGCPWDFGYQNRDEDIEESIKHLKGNMKIISEKSLIEKMVKKFNIVDKEIQTLLDSLKEMHKKQIKEYEEKIKNLKFILGTRNNLRERRRILK